MNTDRAADSDDLPSLERARAAAARGDLADPAAIDAAAELARTLAREPVESRKVAAILFAANMLRRESWQEEIELSPSLFERYPSVMPAVPETFAAAGYQLVDPGRSSHVTKCNNCFLSPGRVMCTRCFGNAPEEGPCPYCNGEPVTCATCDGSGEMVRATLLHVNDTPLVVRRAFLPALPYGIAGPVTAIVEEVRTPPESRRFALQANVVESAYRGASAVRAPEFRGHEFGAALEDALGAERDLDVYKDVVKREVLAYAWPIVALRFAAPESYPVEPDRWLALLDDAAGRLRVVGVDSRVVRRTT